MVIGANHTAPVAQAVSLRRKWRRRLVFMLGSFVTIWAGCSIEKNYKVLSFFFDGVPDPRLLAAGNNAVRIAKETGGVYYVHEPYAQQQCNQCHSGTFTGDMRADVDPRACLKCHSSVANEYQFMHGPVSANACVWCHAPHESTVEPLLRAASPEICQQCHGPAHMGNPKSPIHSDLTRDCLDCHTGHGGHARYYLNSAVIQRPNSGESGPADSRPASKGD